MLSRDAAESLFVESVPAIGRILGALSRRLGFRGDDADDFASWAKMRLVENDYAVVAKFRGESSFTTYLTMVLAMMGREYLVQQRGRWRPSAAAKRLGAVAVRLETLVYRDRLTLSEAAQDLRTRGAMLNERAVMDLFKALPRREGSRPTFVDEESLGTVTSTARADDLVETEASAEERDETLSRLGLALTELDDEARVVLQLHYWEGLSVAEIARALHLPQKPLYRKLQRALLALRRRLEQEGISPAAARALTESELEVGRFRADAPLYYENVNRGTGRGRTKA